MRWLILILLALWFFWPSERPYAMRPRVPLPQRTIIALDGADRATLRAILGQTHRVDEIEVHLAEGAEVPNWLEEMSQPGEVVQVKRYAGAERRNVSAAYERYRGQDMNIIAMRAGGAYGRGVVAALARALASSRGAVAARSYRLERIDGARQEPVEAAMSEGGYIFNVSWLGADYETERLSRPEYREAEDAYTSIRLARRAPIVSLRSRADAAVRARHARDARDPRNYQTPDARAWASVGLRLAQ